MRSAEPRAYRDIELGLMWSDDQISAEESSTSDVTFTKVARDFAECVNRVAYRRESFTPLRGSAHVTHGAMRRRTDA